MKILEGKVAIVTGAGHPKGIGCAIARKLAADGAHVVLTDLERISQLLQLSAQNITTSQNTVTTRTLDVSSSEQASLCVASVMEEFGRLDILVNNAGVGGGSAEFLESDMTDFDLAYRVNVGGIVNLCQAAIPVMLEQESGSIVNISSLCGMGAIPDIPASYTASKFAAVGLSKAIALEYADRGLRCNAVCPGVVNTDMRTQLLDRMAEQYNISPEEAERQENETIAIGRGAEAHEIAEAVAYLVGPAASYVTGLAMPVAGGLAPGL